MNDALIDFSSQPAHEKADSTVVIVMSNGKPGSMIEGTLIETKDNQHMGTERIIEKLNNKNCNKLHRKPRMIILQTHK